jgi:methionyl-tRNA formyltransferase
MGMARVAGWSSALALESKPVKVAIIGRTEILFDTARKLIDHGHDIVCVLTAKEAPEYGRTVDDFRDLAAELNVPFASSAKIVDYRTFLYDAGAEVAVSINYSGIIPYEVTSLFPLGVLNAHGGDLPRYRGNACQAWAILNGESRIGLCIHKMIPGELDNGDIIARDYLPIDLSTKITAVWDWMVRRTPELMIEAVDRLTRDPAYILERQSTNPRDTLRCYPRRSEDGRIDWSKSAETVLRLVNASNHPYAGAFCDLDGTKVIIWDAELLCDGEVFSAVPGQVTSIGEGFVDVAAGSGKVRLKQISVDGKYVPVSNVVRSLRQRFG